MQISTDRELLRQTYRTEDTSQKTFIPAKPKADLYGHDHIFRVCAYCRVSTDSDEQLSSYELQQAHYTHLANEHPNWNLLKIYADEGISGTSRKRRDSFNEMIEDCLHGQYDLIVTKSVSRFARNLVDCVSLVRKLKNLTPPVGVFFETDNLYTLSADSELMLSFLATFAQEESVKKSESMNWSLAQRFKDGKLLTPAPLGYDRPKDVTGRYIKYAPLTINEDEAKVVRFIYDSYLAGWSQEDIAGFLTDIKCPTKTGRTDWNAGSISYILTNERYCGNILTWKTFTADLYEHKHKRNKHDRDQYLYKERHEAIISVEKFEAVMSLMEGKKHHLKGGYPSMHVIDEGIFSGFVPVNHHWVNDDPGTYYDISNSIKKKGGLIRIDKKEFSAFDLKGYQVVRNQFTQIRYEGPVISIYNGKLTFNKFCAKRFDDIPYIQLLLHPAERKMAIRPCKKTDQHSIRWRPDQNKSVNPKTLSCQHFVNALFGIMEWNPDYLYRIRGTWAMRGAEQIMVFNMPNAMPMAYIEDEAEEGSSRKRLDLLPDEWADDFGEEFYEHILANDFYYITSAKEWNAYSESIAAPGMNPLEIPTQDAIQMTLNDYLPRQIKL